MIRHTSSWTARRPRWVALLTGTVLAAGAGLMLHADPALAQKKLSLAELAALEWKLEQGGAALTTNPDVKARQKALDDLASLKDPRTAGPLATALREDPEAAIRLKAAEALAALKTPEAKGLLTVSSTSDPDAEVRKRAAGLLAAFPKRMMVATVPFKPRPFAPAKKAKVDEPLIRTTLASPSGDARLWAIRAMASATVKDRGPLIERHLFQDPSPRVRAEAAKLLVTLDKKRGLPILIRAAEDGNPMVRFEVARLLATYDDAGALTVLGRLASSDENPQVKAEARDLLEPTTEAGKRLLRDRIKKLSSAKEPDRIAALDELATVSHWRAMRPMSCTLLNDESARVRAAAARVLTNMHDSSILTALRVAAVLEPDAKLKDGVRKLLVGMRKRVDALVQQLKSDDATQRVIAGRFLGQAAYPPGLDPLIAALKDKDARVRLAAALGLTNYSEPKASDALKLAAADPDARVRQVADEFFRQQQRLEKYRGFFKDSNRVVMKTQDKDPLWRVQAAIALGVSGAESAVGNLAQLLLHDKDEQVRLAAAWSLVLMANERGELALKNAAAKDPSERVRLTARKYLVIDKVSQEDLIKQLVDASATARQDAAEALSLRPRSAILDPMIKAAVCDPEPGVRMAAMRGLARIGNPLARTAIKVVLSRDPAKEVRKMAFMTFILAGGK